MKIESTRVQCHFEGPPCGPGESYHLIVQQRVGGSFRPRYDLLEAPCDSAFNIPFLSFGQYQIQVWPQRLNLDGAQFVAEELNVRTGADLDLNLKAKGGRVMNGEDPV